MRDENARHAAFPVPASISWFRRRGTFWKAYQDPHASHTGFIDEDSIPLLRLPPNEDVEGVVAPSSSMTSSPLGGSLGTWPAHQLMMGLI
jgi:hypothetical protein